MLDNYDTIIMDRTADEAAVKTKRQQQKHFRGNLIMNLVRKQALRDGSIDSSSRSTTAASSSILQGDSGESDSVKIIDMQVRKRQRDTEIFKTRILANSDIINSAVDVWQRKLKRDLARDSEESRGSRGRRERRESGESGDRSNSGVSEREIREAIKEEIKAMKNRLTTNLDNLLRKILNKNI